VHGEAGVGVMIRAVFMDLRNPVPTKVLFRRILCLKIGF
jgi:hypothetical protein